MADRLRRVWTGRGPAARFVRVLLLPLEGLFRVAVALRGRAFDRGWRPAQAAPIPVVSVGNLTVGGTGKTPVAARIVRELLQMGARPAVVARGYGQDELELHRRWNPIVDVLEARRRLDGVSQAANGGADVAVLDDGFQHRALARDLDVVVIAAEQPFPGALLPRGPYREPPSALARADLAVVTRKTATPARAEAVRHRVENVRPNLPVARAVLEAGAWQRLDGVSAPPPEGDLLAVASIAAPETFEGLVRQATGQAPELLTFRDHHVYREADARAIRARAGARTVVTTEKDAVKLEAFVEELGDVRVLTLDLRFESGQGELRRALARTLPQSGSR